MKFWQAFFTVVFSALAAIIIRAIYRIAGIWLGIGTGILAIVIAIAIFLLIRHLRQSDADRLGMH